MSFLSSISSASETTNPMKMTWFDRFYVRNHSEKKPTWLKKEWIVHDRQNGICSIIRFLEMMEDGNYLVAVARSYQSHKDRNWSRKMGLHYARERMKKYKKILNLGGRCRTIRNLEQKDFIVYAEPYEGKPGKGIYQNRVVFAMGRERILTIKEMEVWHSTILPHVIRDL